MVYLLFPQLRSRVINLGLDSNPAPGVGRAGRGSWQLPEGLEELGLSISALLFKDTIGTCEDSFFIGNFIFLPLKTFFSNVVLLAS